MRSIRTPNSDKPPVSLKQLQELEPLLCQVLASLGYLKVNREPDKPPSIDEQELQALRIRLRSLPNAERRALQGSMTTIDSPTSGVAKGDSVLEEAVQK